jgi:hypothetical protein
MAAGRFGILMMIRSILFSFGSAVVRGAPKRIAAHRLKDLRGRDAKWM